VPGIATAAQLGYQHSGRITSSGAELYFFVVGGGTTLIVGLTAVVGGWSCSFAK
jgi:hypothetical protein